jgi:hypothetical protein
MPDIIAFSNPGEIDPRVWSTFGVSAKETDSSIGQFGTGLKYAIAVLMREERSLAIVSCGKEYIFGVEQTDIRGKEFLQITCNGEPLPFTTHLGRNWELWQAYRELYSNCLDEGGDIGGGGETIIYAEIGDISKQSVFLSSERTPVATSDYCDVYYGESEWLYYRGIRTEFLPKKSLYTYDIKKACLTEDRTFKYTYESEKAITSTVASFLCENENFLWDFLFSTKNFFEEDIDFCWSSSPLGDTLISLAERHLKDDCYMQKSLRRLVMKQLGGLAYTKVEFDERQRKIVEKAADFCEKIGYPLRHPVHLAKDLGARTLAIADRKQGCIYLSDMLLDKGVKQVASTLVEEILHLDKGLDDLTYPMQTYLFDQIVTLGEKLTGEIL